MENIGCKIIVSGNVQAVGFRYYTRNEARKYNLMGHAKNLHNGDVEVVLYGERENVLKMLQWLENGPKTARVDKLAVSGIAYSSQVDFLCF